jgi:hypothetical protein
VLLDDRNEPEPDAMLYRLRPERFEDDYLLGGPELIVEIARSSHARKHLLEALGSWTKTQ